MIRRATSRTLAAALAAGMFTLSTPLAISSSAEARGVRASAAGSMRGAHMSRPSPRPSAARSIDRGTIDRGSVNRNIDRRAVNRSDIQNIDRGDRQIDRGDRQFQGGDREFNFDNDIDIDVDDGWDRDWGDHPIAAGVALGTAAAITSAAIGSWVYSLPPSCYDGFYGGYSYYQCGDIWYQPVYSGDQVTYVVVEQPAEYSDGAAAPSTTTTTTVVPN